MAGGAIATMLAAGIASVDLEIGWATNALQSPFDTRNARRSSSTGDGPGTGPGIRFA